MKRTLHLDEFVRRSRQQLDELVGGSQKQLGDWLKARYQSDEELWEKFRRELEDFRSRLRTFRVGHSTALELIETHSLDLRDLYVLHRSFFFRSSASEPNPYKILSHFQASWKEVVGFAQSLKNAADALRVMSILRFPYRKAQTDPNSVQGVESADLVSNPFAPAHYKTDKHDLPPRKGELPPLAEWIDGCVAEDGADWRSPYHIPRELAELFMRSNRCGSILRRVISGTR